MPLGWRTNPRGCNIPYPTIATVSQGQTPTDPPTPSSHSWPNHKIRNCTPKFYSPYVTDITFHPPTDNPSRFISSRVENSFS